MMFIRVLMVCLCFFIAGCATTTGELDPLAVRDASPILSFPDYSGERVVVAVLPLGLTKDTAAKYPHLLEKSVGLGIHNLVVEALYDSRRFRLVEEKAEIVKDIMQRQWMSAAGMVQQQTAVELGRVLGANKVIYGEVFDFAEGGERIAGFTAKKNLTTRMGVQVRYVDVETLEYIPGTGVGIGADVAGAADKAVMAAIVKMVKRLP